MAQPGQPPSNHYFTRRRLLAMLGLAAVPVLVNTWTGQSSNARFMLGPAQGDGSGGNAAAVPLDLTFGGYHDYRLFGYTEIQESFGKANPSIKVNPAFWYPSNYEDEMRELLASNMAPEVLELSDDTLPLYADSRYLQPITEQAWQLLRGRTDLSPDALLWGYWGGQRWGWPLGAWSRVIYVNLSLFQRAGVDPPVRSSWEQSGWTWDDFLQAALALLPKLPGTTPKIWPCALLHDFGVLETFAVNNGGEGIFSQDGRRFALPQVQEAAAVEWLAALAHVHKVAPSPTAPGAEDARQMFADGRVAMLFDSSGLISKLRPVKFDFEWDITSVPARRRRGTLGRIPMLGIAAKASLPAAAWTFLSYCWTDPAQSILAKQACLAPIKKDRLALMSGGSSIPRSIGLLPQAMENLILPAYTPYTERATRVFRGLLQYVWSGERSAYEVLGAIKNEVEEALAP